MITQTSEARLENSPTIPVEKLPKPRVLSSDEIVEYLSHPELLSALDVQMLQFFVSYQEKPLKYPNRVIVSYLRKYLEQSHTESSLQNSNINTIIKNRNIRKTALALLKKYKVLPETKIDWLSSKLERRVLHKTQAESLYAKFTPDTSHKRQEAQSLSPEEIRLYLANPEGLSPIDITFLQFILKMDLESPEYLLIDLIKEIETYIQKSIAEDNSKKPDEPISIKKIRLRKTAFSIYRFSIIPKQKTVEGGFKMATLPIGVDPDLFSDYLQHVMRIIGPVWKWDGRFPKYIQETYTEQPKRNTEQLVRLTSSRGQIAREMSEYAQKFLEIPVVSPDIIDELDQIQKLANQLGNPVYLPKIHRKGNSRRFMHSTYLKNTYESTSSTEVIQSSLALAHALEELWQKAGKINTDIKPDNIRKNNQRELVITDWGEVITITPGQKTIQMPKKVISTLKFQWPEKDTRLLEEEVAIPVEKILVYDVGKMLLCDIYGKHRVVEAVNMKIGHEIKNENQYCINHETAAYLRQRNQLIHVVSEKVLDLIEKMVADNPEDRPNLDEVKNILREEL